MILTLVHILNNLFLSLFLDKLSFIPDQALLGWICTSAKPLLLH